MRHTILLIFFFNASIARANALISDSVAVEILPNEGSSRGARAVGDFRAQPQVVWRALTNYSAWPIYMPNVTEASILRETENTIWLKSKASAAMTSFEFTLIFVHNRNTYPWKITWKRDSGDVKTMNGHYLINETASGTHLEYVNFIDAGFYIPEFIQNALTKLAIPRMFNNMGEYISKLLRDEN